MARTVIDDPAPPPAPQPRGSGNPSPQGYPPQGYPPQGYPPQGYPPQGYPPPRGARRAGRVPRWVIVAGASVAGLLLTGALVYFGLFYYSPVALRHVPPGTSVAVRVDLVDVAVFGPVRRNLLPIVNEPSPGAAQVAGGTRSERIGDAVGVNLSRDIREAVVCFVGDVDRVVIVVGGNIPRGKLVPGLLKVAQQESSTEWISGGDILRSRSGTAFVGQADDGSAIIATDEGTLRAALPASDEYKRVGVPETGSVAYAMTGDTWKRLGTSSYASLLESLQSLRALDGVNGHLTLGNAPVLESQVLVAQGTNPEDAKATLYRVFTDLRRLSELRRKLTGSAQDLAGEEQALAQSNVTTKGPSLLSVVTPWPYDGLDRGAQNLAQKIRAARSGKPAVQPPGNIVLPGGIPLPIALPGLP